MAGGLGVYLRDRRTQLRLTQERVAKAAGISRSHLSQIESGKIGLPNAETRRLLAKTLSIDHLDLLIAAGELSAEEAVANCPGFRSELGEIFDRLDPESRDVLLSLARLLARRDRSEPGTASEASG